MINEKVIMDVQKKDAVETRPALSVLNKKLPVFTVKAGSVYDGDTIRVISDKGKELKIRFACIDAPELSQTYGIQSRDYLSSLLEFHDNKVYLDIINTDRYGRKIAVLYLNNGQAVQNLQVKNGWVYPYQRYKSNCPIWDEIKRAEEIAIKNQANLYSGNYEKPWDYRRK